jgi:hypothetical protein
MTNKPPKNRFMVIVSDKATDLEQHNLRGMFPTKEEADGYAKEQESKGYKASVTTLSGE